MKSRRFLSATVVAGLVALAAALPVEAKATKKTTAKATAECNDGTFSHAKTQQGACSKHGGVKTWYGEAGAPATTSSKTTATKTAPSAPSTTKAEPKTTTKASKEVGTKVPEKPVAAAPAGTPANATAKCKDGTYSYAKQHSGACSHHGGVAEWYK
jgi:uncharacterized protein DUF3761